MGYPVGPALVVLLSARLDPLGITPIRRAVSLIELLVLPRF